LQGHVDSQFKLGLMYQYGTGVSLDLREAGLWYQMAAEQRHVAAMYQLGVMYDTTVNVSVPSATPWECDDRKAVYWYTAAAKRGNAEAQFSLSLCYFEGRGISLTHTHTLSRSLSHSLTRCHRISGIAADIPLAMAWCSKSAGEGKHAPAMQYLGEIYNRGLPTVPKDPTLAAQWFRLASDPDATVPSYSTDAITGAGAASTSTATLDSGASTAVPSAHSPDLECHMKCHSHTDVLARRHSGHRGPPA